MFRKAFKNVCTSTIAGSSDALPPTSSTSPATKTPEKTQEERGYPEPADKGDTELEYSSEQVSSYKKLPVRT